MPRLRIAIVRSIKVVKRQKKPKPKPVPGRESWRGLQPGGIDYRPNFWHRVSSSWIKALRFVPTGVGAKQQVTGYVDMWVKWRGRKYRYGPGVYHHRFSDWIEAASKGRFWWYRWTKEWSPATRL